MTSFKTTAPVQFCTSLDVRALADLLKVGIYIQPKDDINVITSNDQIDNHIIQATGYVDSTLRKISGGTSGLYVPAPYGGRPLNNVNNSSWGTVSAPRLEGVGVAAGAVTELWTVRFTGASTGAFSVYGSVSGAQGTGTTSALFTATDSDITIATASWLQTDTTFQPEDRIDIPVYKALPSIVRVTAWLACADVLDSFFSEVSPNTSSLGEKLYRRAEKFLDALVKGERKLSSAATSAREFQEIAANGLTMLGDDISDYDTVTGIGTVRDDFDVSVQ